MVEVEEGWLGGSQLLLLSGHVALMDTGGSGH